MPRGTPEAFCDEGHARILRERAVMLRAWFTYASDEKLAQFVSARIAEKFERPERRRRNDGWTYPPGCTLVVGAVPFLTSADRFAELLPSVSVPAGHPWGAVSCAAAVLSASRWRGVSAVG
jgi:hypothetical protein